MSPKLPKLLKNKFILIGIIAAILVVLLLAFLYIDITSTITKLTPVVTVVGPVSLSASIAGKGVLTYNYATKLAAYATLNYAVANATQANLSLSVYQKDPLSHIYLVNTGAACNSCFDEPSLYSSLATSLQNAGLIQNATTLQSVDQYTLSTTPGNSIIILSTGLMPASLLPFTGVVQTPGVANITILNLLNRGDAIIYVGQNFSKMLNQNGQIYITPQATIANLSKDGIATFSHTNFTESQLNFSTPSYAFRGGYLYGAVAYANVTNGTLIAFSNSPTAIWKNTSLEASDLTKAIQSRFWINLLANGFYNFSIANTTPVSTRLNLYTTNSTLNYTRSALINNSYSLVHARFSNKNYKLNVELPLSLSFNQSGTLAMPSVIGYGNLIQIQTKINRPSSRLAFSIALYDRGMNFVNSNSIGFFNTSLPIIYYYSFGNIRVGSYYLARLVDINDKAYSQALFYVPYLNVTPTYANFKTGNFSFAVVSNGQSVSGLGYQISLNGAYNESGTLQNGELNYILPKGAIINYGYQLLSISLGNNIYPITEYYAQPASIPSLYIEFGAAALVIILLNFILRAPNIDEYYIDVSSLPPTKKQEVTLSGDTIVNLFDTINLHFHWRYMPLTSEEVKNGVNTNIRFGNTPVSITLQNTNEVLYKLAAQGKLIYSDEYYIPKTWLDTAKHDIEYLIIFRKLRDFFVEHAIFFTDLDVSTEADTVITVKNKQTPIFIYSTLSGMRTAPLHKGTKTFFVMINGEVRQELQEKLYNTYGKKSSALRLAIESNNLEIIDVDHLDELLY